MLGVANEQLEQAADWSRRDEKLKWTLHTLVAVFGGILKTEDLVQQVQTDSDAGFVPMAELAYELKFLLLDLLGLYYELNYSTWNLINFFSSRAHLNEEQITRFLTPAVQPPIDMPSIAQEEQGERVLQQALGNWEHWCQAYMTLMIRAYDARQTDSTVAFQSLLAVSAHLISAAQVGSLLLFSRARSTDGYRTGA